MGIQYIRRGVAGLAFLCVLAHGGAAVGEEYVVRKGDTLQKIAKARLGSEDRWAELARLNGLASPFTIHAGQKLQLPAEPPDASRAVSPAVASRESPATETVAVARGGGAASPAGTSSGRESRPGQRALFWGGVGLLVLAGAIWVAGALLFLIAAFSESFWWGIGAILVHPVWLVFLCKFWDKAKKGFLLQLAAGGVAACGIAVFFLAPFLR